MIKILRKVRNTKKPLLIYLTETSKPKQARSPFLQRSFCQMVPVSNRSGHNKNNRHIGRCFPSDGEHEAPYAGRKDLSVGFSLTFTQNSGSPQCLGLDILGKGNLLGYIC